MGTGPPFTGRGIRGGENPVAGTAGLGETWGASADFAYESRGPWGDVHNPSGWPSGYSAARQRAGRLAGQPRGSGPAVFLKSWKKKGSPGRGTTEKSGEENQTNARARDDPGGPGKPTPSGGLRIPGTVSYRGGGKKKKKNKCVRKEKKQPTRGAKGAYRRKKPSGPGIGSPGRLGPLRDGAILKPSPREKNGRNKKLGAPRLPTDRY